MFLLEALKLKWQDCNDHSQKEELCKQLFNFYHQTGLLQIMSITEDELSDNNIPAYAVY